MISIICACNNEDLFNNMLVASIKKQNYKDFEIIKVDAKKQGFKSASEALNYGASTSKGDLLIFVHQDVELVDELFFEKLVEICKSLDFGVAGVAGMLEKENKVYSSVTMDKDKRQAVIKNTNIMEVDSLDECLLIIKKDNFKGFSEYKSWHFYAVEYSLRCKRNNEKIFIFPLDIYHLSPGWSLNESYWKTLKLVAKDFKDFKIIPTTMGCYKNNAFLSLYIFNKKIRQSLKKLIRK